MKRIFRRSVIWRHCIVVALVVITALGAGIWVKMSAAEDGAAASEQRPPVSPESLVSMQQTPRPTALFLGDDFAAGYEGIYVYAYPYIVCDAFALNCNVEAQAGTGFINDGKGRSPKNSRLIDRLPRDRQIYSADLIVIDSGRNDVEAGVEAYGQALEQYLGEVRGAWPVAKIAVIAPAPFTSEPYPGYSDLVSVIARITESFGGVVIDPVAEGWYRDVDLSVYQTPDHLLPNQAGHQLIAQKLAESLARLGLAQPRLPVQ